MKWTLRTVVLLICALHGPIALAQGLPETIRRIKPSIVAVGTINQLRPNKPVGTAFVVGDGNMALTNSHVVQAALNDTSGTMVVFIGTGMTVRAQPATLVAEDRQHDIALLRFGGPGLPALQLADETAEEGESIAFTGYPLTAVYGLHPATSRGIVSAVTPIVIPQLSDRTLTPDVIARQRNVYDVLQLDATAYPGNSGSPVYLTDTGRVIGVVSSVFVKETKETIISNPSAITFAIPIKYGRALIDAAR